MLSAQIPAELREALEECVDGMPLGGLRSAAHAISQVYREGRQPAFRTEEERLAYAITRMPATYGAVCAVLRELEDPVGSVLDLGAGTGAGAWAIQESFSTAVSETSGTDWPVGDGLEVVLLEQNPDLIALSQRISTPATSWHPGNMLNLSGFAPADLILMSYSLGELGPRDRILALHSAWSLARKYLAVIEPGTPTGFSTILAARDHLLAQGASITAPCPHPSACPMTPPDWCHFAVRVGRTRLHKLLKEGDLGYEDEKFSYVLAAKPDASLARAADARILRHPTVYPGLVSLTLCDRQGIRPVEVRAKDKTTFKAARKASWGSRWAFPK